MTASNDDFFRVVRSAAATRAGAVLRRYGLSAAEREDLQQDLVVDLLERAGQFDPARGSAGTFTGLVSQNRSVEWVDRLIKDRQRLAFPGNAPASNDADYQDDDGDWPLNVVPLWADDRDLFADSDLLHDLQVALDHMTDQQLDLFRLLETHQDLSSAAKVAGVSTATFYRRVTDLQMHLRMFGIKAA